MAGILGGAEIVEGNRKADPTSIANNYVHMMYENVRYRLRGVTR